MSDINTNYIYASAPASVSSVSSVLSVPSVVTASTAPSASASSIPDSSSSSNSSSSDSAASNGTAAAAAGAGGAPGAGAGGGGGGTDPNELLLFHFLTSLIILLAILFLFRLPRAIARFRTREGRRGFMFDLNFSSNSKGSSSRGSNTNTRGGEEEGGEKADEDDDDDRSMRTLTRVDTQSDEGSTIAMHGYAGYGYGKGGVGGIAGGGGGGGYGASSTTNLKAVSSQGHYTSTSPPPPALPPKSSSKSESKSVSPPPHVPSYSALSLTAPLASLLSYTPFPSSSYSIGRLLFILAYLAGLTTVLAIQNGNPLSSPVRIGWAAVVQIPVTVALGTKNNVIGMLVGVGYERLNFFHRFVGVVSFLCGLGHVVGYTYKWVIAGTFTSHISTPYIQCGLLSFLGLTLLTLFSLPLIRTFAYNLFLLSHIIGLGLYLGAICYHQAGTTHYVVLALVIYAIDHVFRVVKTRVGWAWCTPVPALGVTRVEVKGIRSGWRAGQHVRIRVLTTQFGGGGGGGGGSGSGSGGGSGGWWRGWSVAHPFTIVNASGNKRGEGMVLFVKKAGKWTNGLYDAASGEPDFFESNGRVESGFGRGGGVLSTSSSSSNPNPFSNGGPPYIATSGRTFRVLIEGPYGGPNDTVFSSFTGVMLIGGGSGITFPLSVCEEVVAGVRAGRSCVRFVEVVWVTKGREDVGELIPIFRRLLGRDGAGGGARRRVGLKISVYYSRASGSGEKRNSSGVGGGDGGDGIDASIKSLEPDLVLCSGRPRLSNVISSLVDVVGQVGASTSTSGSGAGGVNGVVVGVCGPAGLGRDVKEAVRGLDGGRKRACGGVEVHEEIFGW